IALATLLIVDNCVSGQDHWSFRPIERTVPPVVSNSQFLGNAIDSFVFQRLEAEGIAPAVEADKRTLLRRVTFDLIGLPPTPGEVAEFLADDSPDAYDRVVERLLVSPRYGERWARPWLDACHYGDSDGHLTDQLRPVAWRYRAWLVNALNRNLPFDQFTIQQLAGDLLPGGGQEEFLATGFLRQTLSNREGGADLEEYRVAQVVDRTNMVGTIWLGLTVGCARCHDHKYDPISQEEYFRLYAFFDNAAEVNLDAPLAEENDAFVASRPEYERQRDELIAPVREELETLQKRWEKMALHAADHPGEDHVWDRQWELLGLIWGGHLGEGQLEGTEICRLPWDQRTARQRADLLDYFLSHGAIVDGPKFDALQLGTLRTQLVALRQKFPTATRGAGMRATLQPRRTFIHERGEFRSPGAFVDPDTPAVLPAVVASEEPTRLELAQWLVSPVNPLTPRVTVNRVWQEFFGHGLVGTANDFGKRGDRPTHPELLDWLSRDYVASGWDTKRLHRLIVTSATYRQSSRPRAELRQRDPENRWLARQASLRVRQASLRVSAEAVRDSALAVSGLLCDRMGGPSVKPPQNERVTMEAFGSNDWKPSAGGDRYRRGLYTFVLRTSPFAQGITFDAPPPTDVCTRRPRSNTPLQALTLLNDPVFFEMAQGLATRLLSVPDVDDAGRIDHALQLCLGRGGSPAEIKRLRSYVEQLREAFAKNSEAVPATLGDREPPSGTTPAEFAAWTHVASVLLNLHEFITRD
ncbi:MAG: DUF1549 and DUF1553 domain-containing protein, partial [Planctomycetota bacterium]|nr:DUF1549 and DUF1553 domain-containing protein [Planctomycetota bacterium]